MDELYIVNSFGNPSDYPDAAQNQDGQVELDWFCHGRSQPIAPYHMLITDYAQLEEPDKGNAEHYMDELFTRAEASLFIPYLCFSYGHLVGISVVPVPMDIFGSDGRSIANPVGMLLADCRWKIAHTVSPAEVDYPLPFSISAYYRVKDDGCRRRDEAGMTMRILICGLPGWARQRVPSGLSMRGQPERPAGGSSFESMDRRHRA